MSTCFRFLLSHGNHTNQTELFVCGQDLVVAIQGLAVVITIITPGWLLEEL